MKKEYVKLSYCDNRDRTEYFKEYNSRPEVKERKKNYSKQSREKKKNTPEVIEQNKKVNKKRKEDYRTFGDYFVSNIFKGAKKRNKNKLKKPFTITQEYIKEILPKNLKCPVLGIKFKVHDGPGPAFNSASLDRIDNDKGYEIGNVIWVCNKVNMIKNFSTPDEIIKVGKFYKRLLKERF